MTDSRRLVVVLCTLAAALVVLPAVAGSETSQIVSAFGGEEGIYKYPPYWSPAEVHVEAGGHVTFANTSTTVKHGIIWTGPTPACETSVPVGVGGAKTSWSGNCTFSQPGEYTFYCSYHGPEMSGKIVVHANGTITPGPTSGSPGAPPPSPGSGGSAGGSGTEGGPSGGAGSPLAGGSHALRLAAAQRGSSVHGSIDIASAGGKGRLEVALFARSASLAAVHHPAGVRVGRLTRSPVRAGVLSFTVPLSARARGALHRHHRLALTAQIVLTPVAGAPASVTRSVTLRG
jgi:plastocyanin